jgi:2-hydroxy-4-carboxymuconate semialdehyde hemiacetal dehydrogenase
MKICIAGEGAQGKSYLEALKLLDNVEVVSIAGGNADATATMAKDWNIPHHSVELEECLSRPGVEAVILATPNHLHFEQSKLAIEKGVHVKVEIPMGVSYAECEQLNELAEKSGVKCMVAHTLRFQPMMRQIYDWVNQDKLNLHHIIYSSYFFRRQNKNRFGQPRGWKDDILWHHGCHFVDFTYWLFGDEADDIEVWGQAGPENDELGCPLDMTLSMRSKSGCLMTTNLSYNTHGPLDWEFRFIGTEETYRVYEGDRMLNHKGSVVMKEEGEIATFALQLNEFFSAINDDREPLTSFNKVLPVMQLLDRMEKQIFVSI